MPSNKEHRYATLDGLRAAAALVVAFYHFQQRLNVQTIPGYLAVDLFFCLSGFVLARNYQAALLSGRFAREFCTRRIVRLYPLYAAGTLVGLSTFFINPTVFADQGASVPFPASIVFGCIMMPTPHTTALFPINGAAWSLFLEIVVNVVFAIWLARLATRGLAWCCGVSLMVLACGLHFPDYLNVGWNWDNLWLGVFRATFSFCAGMLLHRRLGRGRGHQSRFAIPLILICVIPCALTLDQVDPTMRDLAWMALGSPLAIAICASLEPGPRIRHLCHWCGAVSFSLYATHWPLAALLKPALIQMPPWLGAAVFLSAAVAIAYLAQQLVDAPVQRWVRTIRAGQSARYAGEFTTTPAAAR